jgi:Na+-translocating ferredoxin:NAD+ oxidoreductase subunit E
MSAQAPTSSSQEEPAPDVLALFALCPLLAVSDTIANALSASIAMLFVTIGSTLIAAFLPRWLLNEMRFASLALVVTAVVAVIALLVQAWLPGVFDSLGVFLALIVSNVLLLVQAQATPGAPVRALASAARTTVFVVVTMLVLSIGRELVGRGSLMRESDMFGDWADGLHQQLFREDMGFLLAVLPPGAFIALGLLFAAAKWWRRRRAHE